MISVFRKNGFTGWRRNYPLEGRPDFVFPKQRIAVFVDGCFWHGHPSRCRVPASNREYWTAKIEKNKKRDRLVNRRLKEMGWKTLRVWEHEVDSAKTAGRIEKALSERSGGEASSEVLSRSKSERTKLSGNARRTK
jgi:DNA mismatch endonuclease (patch repair protein)